MFIQIILGILIILQIVLMIQMIYRNHTEHKASMKWYEQVLKEQEAMIKHFEAEVESCELIGCAKAEECEPDADKK